MRLMVHTHRETYPGGIHTQGGITWYIHLQTLSGRYNLVYTPLNPSGRHSLVYTPLYTPRGGIAWYIHPSTPLGEA